MLKNMNKEFTFEIDVLKTEEDIQQGDWVCSGYAMTSDLDSDSTIITRDAIEGAKDDLLKYSTVLFNHDKDRPVAKVVNAFPDDYGLLVKIVVSKTEEELWNKIKEGIVSKFSIKGRATDIDEVVGGDNQKILKINKLELYEVSLVSVPANVEAKTISWYVAKSLDENMNIVKDKEIESKELENSGVTEKSLSLTDIVSALKTALTKKTFSALSQSVQSLLDVISAEDASTATPQKEFAFEDTGDERPLFQLHSSGKIDLGEGNRFRKQLLKIGKWYYWGAEGGVLDITKEKISQLVKNFKDKILDHITVPLTHTQNPALNTGEVVDLIQTADGLDVICEIKDETVAEKIKKGLIQSISASIDPNYFNKVSGNFTGPVLLHAALVHEPYIKGMREFVELGEEFKDRPVFQLEDSELTIEQNFQLIRNAFEKLEKQLEIRGEATEKMNTNQPILEFEIPADIEKDIEKTAYTDCMKREMKAGAAMADAAKTCTAEVKKEDVKKEEKVEEVKQEVKKELASEEATGEAVVETVQPEVKSEETIKQEKVDLADAEGLYEKYLKGGKIVPSQKESLVKLLTSKKVIDLGEDQKVDLKETVIAFLENQPKVVNFQEQGTSEPAQTEKPQAQADIMPEDVKAFYKNRMNFSEEDALKAWEDAKDRQKAEGEKSTIF